MTEIDEIKADEQNVTQPTSRRRRRRVGQSLFGPVVLIGLGVALLLINIGRLPDPNWYAALRLWPIFLILIGLNIIVLQVPRPVGSFLSLAVGLLCVGIFGYALFYSDQMTLPAGLNELVTSEWSQEELSVPLDEVEGAQIEIGLGPLGADLGALVDSQNLFEADIKYLGDYTFEVDTADGQAEILLDARDVGLPFFGFITDLDTRPDDEPWRVGIAPNVPARLILHGGSGPGDFDLEELKLEGLEYSGGSGSTEMNLPEGVYNLDMDLGSGSSNVSLPTGGQTQLRISGGSGRLTIEVPRDIAVRLEVDDGSGSLDIQDRRLQMVNGAEEAGVWETESFEGADDWVEVFVEMGSGSVVVSPE